MFDSPAFYSEFSILETTRYEALTDKLKLCYFELPKLPQEIDSYNEQLLRIKVQSLRIKVQPLRIKTRSSRSYR